MTVATLTATMSHRELAEWRAWFSTEPRGEERADWQTGWLTLWLVAINTSGKERKKLRWQDFVPFRRQAEEAEPADLSAKVKAVFAKFKKAG